MSEEIKYIKKLRICVVGHGLGPDGKAAVLTNLLGHWTADRTIRERTTFPTMLDEFEIPFDMKTRKIGSTSDESVLLSFKDANPRADALRRVSYPGTDVFLVVISVVRLPMGESLKGDIKTWLAELSQNAPGVPVVIVGVMTHKRQDKEILARLEEKKKVPLSYEDGVKEAKAGSASYLEIDLRLTDMKDWNICLQLCGSRGLAYAKTKGPETPQSRPAQGGCLLS